MASYRNLLHVPTNSWVSEWRSGEIHQEPQTGRLFVFSRDGLFTALSRTGGWRIAYPPGGWDARYAPAGNIYEMNVQPEAIGEFPRFEPGKDWFHFLLNGATCEETTDTVSLEPESNRSSGVTMRLVDWPGGAWLERRQDKVTLHGRNGQEVLLTDREELDRHRNQGSVAVMEAALSPDQEFAALVVETHPPREDDTFYGTPRYRGIPSGFIVVYKLGDATEAAHVPMITHVGDEYAR
ncbi:MAG: hypothetical protein NTW86_01020 [Candidatus Sumerlaeota bacterium]|nr:hypothetical protein [Candidatus Sumerlaeota bacterium]